jgi:CDP-diacylglycerol--serine O-phosphatidyltransferase
MSSSDPEAGVLELLRLPDLVTILNILFGFTAILFVLNRDTDGAIILILAAALADGVDGAVARRFESGVFGEHLDSFADAISFGVAPAVIYYAIVSAEHHTIACAFSAAYLICGVLRLVRFSILDVAEFRGIPITAAGAFAVMSVYLTNSLHLATGVFAILSLLMVSNIPYPKVRSTPVLMLLTIVFVLTIAAHCIGLYNWFAWILLIMLGMYVLTPLIGGGRIYAGRSQRS